MQIILLIPGDFEALNFCCKCYRKDQLQKKCINYFPKGIHKKRKEYKKIVREIQKEI